MIYLLELFFSTFRILLLFFAIIIIYIFGNAVYININNFLYSSTSPCVEIISMLIAFVPVIGLLYGIHIKKSFWKRSFQYNLIVFVISYAFGVIIAFLPFGGTLGFSNSFILFCPQQPTFLTKISESIATGLISALLAYLGMDFGITLKRFSHQTMKDKDSHKTHLKRK